MKRTTQRPMIESIWTFMESGLRSRLSHLCLVVGGWQRSAARDRIGLVCAAALHIIVDTTDHKKLWSVMGSFAASRCQRGFVFWRDERWEKQLVQVLPLLFLVNTRNLYIAYCYYCNYFLLLHHCVCTNFADAFTCQCHLNLSRPT